MQYETEEQAASGQDYVATQGKIIIRDGVKKGTVPVQLLRVRHRGSRKKHL